MALVDINEFIPGGWDEISTEISRMYEKRYQDADAFPAVDISKINVPADMREKLRGYNSKRMQANPSELLPPRDLIEKMSDLDNFPTGSEERGNLFNQLDEWILDASFDEQLLELIDMSSKKYQPDEFISQLVEIIVQFLNRSACFRTGTLADSLSLPEANQCVEVIKNAWVRSNDAEEKTLLELLMCDLTYGGETPWFAQLPASLKDFCRKIMSRHT